MPKEAKLGPIRSQSDITVDISTRPALRVWSGRDGTSERRGILGIPGFAAITKQMEDQIRADDPYADYHYYLIEESLAKLKAELDQEFHSITSFMEEAIPAAMTVPSTKSAEPCTLPIRFASKPGFSILYELLKMDSIVLKVLLSNHIGLLNTEEKFATLKRLVTKMRATMYLVYRYKVTGVTRDDMAANNQVAKRAIEAMGELKSEFLEGTTRAQGAPQLPSKRLATLVSTAEDGEEDEGLSEEDEKLASEVGADFTELTAELDKVAPKAATRKARATKTESA
ncbi:hypothetical protein DOK_11711 [gamma proteobacterium BDW918]|nr:hypothetical protein DOK_11711 [gamma proteobacterium BDW918]